MTDCYASKYKTACLCSFIIFFAQSKKYFIYVCTTIGRHKPYHSGKQSSTCLGCIGTITLQVAMSGMSSHIHHPSVEERFSLGKKNLNTVSLLVVLQSHRLSLLWNTERESERKTVLPFKEMLTSPVQHLGLPCDPSTLDEHNNVAPKLPYTFSTQALMWKFA